MQVSIPELKMNAGKYVNMAQNQDIYIARHGKRVAKIVSINADKTALLDAFVGILPEDVDLAVACTERLKRLT